MLADFDGGQAPASVTGNRRLSARERTLRLFAPQVRHGGIAAHGSTCTVRVFHIRLDRAGNLPLPSGR